MKFALLAIAILIPFAIQSSAGISRAASPLVPAYAADQPELTFEALYGEANQFQQMLTWNTILGDLNAKIIDRDLLKGHFEHGRQLRGSDTITEHEFKKREFDYLVAEERVKELEARAVMMKLSVETAKFRILMNGDPSKDLRKDIAENMKESLEYQRVAQQHDLKAAELNREHRKRIVEESEDLVRNRIITNVEFALRQGAFETAKIQCQTAHQRIEVLNKAIEGMDRSLARLFGGH